MSAHIDAAKLIDTTADELREILEHHNKVPGAFFVGVATTIGTKTAVTARLNYHHPHTLMPLVVKLLLEIRDCDGIGQEQLAMIRQALIVLGFPPDFTPALPS